MGTSEHSENNISSEHPLLEVKNVKQHFPVRKGLFKSPSYVKAVDGVSFDVYPEETLGLVGESGCGKSTIGRTLLRLIEPTEGECYYRGKNIYNQTMSDFNKIRKDLQMVFQDPYSSLNPKIRIGKTLEETLVINNICKKQERTDIVMNILKKVGLTAEHYFRYPHEFSGGQRQRIGLARALILSPKLIVCDEAVSALDVSIQAQVLNLMKEIKREFKLSYIFISHDLGVVRYISDRVGVMYLGKVVEIAPSEELFENPKHPYTQALISALPATHPSSKKERIKLEGEVPSPVSPPSGCHFHTRCPHANEYCRSVPPQLIRLKSGHYVSCHLYSHPI